MVHLILVHGRSQQYAVPEGEERELREATHWGFDQAGSSHLREIPLAFAFYGDLYKRRLDDAARTRGAEPEASQQLQVAIAADLLEELAGQPQARVNFRDLTRLVAALDERFHVGELYLKRFMGDVAAYLEDEDLREQTIERVAETVRAGGDEVVIAAHSLGSIVAYDMFLRHPDLPVRGFVSFGSPLGLPTIRRRLKERVPLKFPSVVPQWVNVFNREDFVCAVPLLSPLYPSKDGRGVDDVETIGREPTPRDPGAAHDIAIYLSSAEMARQMARLLEQEARAVPRTRRDAPEDDLEFRFEDNAEAADEDAAAAIPGVPSPDAGPAMRAVERTVSAAFPPHVKPESDHLLDYAIARKAVHAGASAPVRMRVPPEIHEVSLTVSVHARDFDVLDAYTGEKRHRHHVTIDLDDVDHQIAGSFTLRAHAADAVLPTTVHLVVSDATIPVAELELETIISPARVRVQPADRPSAGGAMRVSFEAAPPPDILIHVRKDRHAERYNITADRLDSRAIFGLDLGEFEVAGDGSAFAGSILDQFENADSMSPANRQIRLDGLGVSLWWNLPEAFRTFYWDEIHGQDLTLAIHSDEPYIPWELVKPQRKRGDGETADMLGLAFSMGRWRKQRYFPNPLNVSGFAVIAPLYRDNPLEYAQQEAEDLKTRHRARAVDGRHAPVMDLLRGTATQAIHFAGHGRFEPERPGESVIELIDTPLVPTDVGVSTIGGSDRPLVFVNACEVGNHGWSLTQIGGWADAFCDVGCTAFVGPYWAVDDVVARKAALCFYQELVGQATVGEAMRTVRRQYWEDDEFRHHPSWLAYTLHCHPNVTVTFEDGGP